MLFKLKMKHANIKKCFKKIIFHIKYIYINKVNNKELRCLSYSIFYIIYKKLENIRH